MTTRMDTAFSDAVERELAAIGTHRSRLRRHRRRVRATAAVGGFLLAGALTGAAVVVVGNLPGEITITPLGDAVTATHTGTGQVELDTMPDGAGSVWLEVSCSGTGTIAVRLAGPGDPDVFWKCREARNPVRIKDGRLPEVGSTSITITADPGVTWTASARYATREMTEWGVNESGQTYGVPNDHGVPDLNAARATNGRVGYILIRELTAFEGEGTIDVYEKDGQTVIGEFRIGDSE